MGEFFQSVDWAATGTLWSGLGALLAGAATIALAIYARRGLNAWKEQQLGIKKLDLAQELLAEVYTTEEVLKYVISPFVSASELSAVERADWETDEDYELRKTYDAVIVRYESHADQFSKVRALLFRARAILGTGPYEAVKELLLMRNSVQGASHRAFLAAKDVARMERQVQIGMVVDGDRYATALADLSSAQERFWGLGEGDNLSKEIERRVATCVQELEKIRDSIVG